MRTEDRRGINSRQPCLTLTRGSGIHRNITGTETGTNRHGDIRRGAGSRFVLAPDNREDRGQACGAPGRTRTGEFRDGAAPRRRAGLRCRGARGCGDLSRHRRRTSRPGAGRRPAHGGADRDPRPRGARRGRSERLCARACRPAAPAAPGAQRDGAGAVGRRRTGLRRSRLPACARPRPAGRARRGRSSLLRGGQARRCAVGGRRGRPSRRAVAGAGRGARQSRPAGPDGDPAAAPAGADRRPARAAAAPGRDCRTDRRAGAAPGRDRPRCAACHAGRTAPRFARPCGLRGDRRQGPSRLPRTFLPGVEPK
ncbi:hypothetical protein RHIZO_02258 [Rhizobiaceae bacterium]|nr:hypothetical protein RHIZO_02258 [Rhizobiaceae bacterium]